MFTSIALVEFIRIKETTAMSFCCQLQQPDTADTDTA